jgi:hypothetical protein
MPINNRHNVLAVNKPARNDRNEGVFIEYHSTNNAVEPAVVKPTSRLTMETVGPTQLVP